MINFIVSINLGFLDQWQFINEKSKDTCRLDQSVFHRKVQGTYKKIGLACTLEFSNSSGSFVIWIIHIETEILSSLILKASNAINLMLLKWATIGFGNSYMFS
jgi:hypothetical protein